MQDEKGIRLAKRHDALSLKTLREQGVSPASIVEKFEREEGEREKG